MKRLGHKMIAKLPFLESGLNKHEVSKVLKFYDLDPWQCMQHVNGGNSDNLVLDTPRGKRLFKRYHSANESIKLEHYVLEYLHHRNFSCPAIETNRNALSYSELDGQYYAIYEFIDGQNYASQAALPQPAEPLITSAAQTLARLDQLLGTLDDSTLPTPMLPEESTKPEQLNDKLHVVDAYFELIKTALCSQKEREVRKKLLDDIKICLEENWQDKSKLTAHLPTQLVHYDYAPKNLIYDRHQVKSVLDFGELRVDFRLSDLVRGMTSFSKSKGKNLDWQRSLLFLNAYQSILPLSEPELMAIKTLIRGRIIGTILELMKTTLSKRWRPYHRGVNEVSFKRIQKKTKYLGWLETNEAEFQKLISSSMRQH